MTFCDHCGKKLSNNFQEWKKFNPGKSFNDYKIEINSEEELIIQPQRNKTPRKKQFPLIIGLTIAVLLLAEAYYLGFTGLQQFKDIESQRSGINNIEESVNWRQMEDKAGIFKLRFPGTAQKDVQTQELEGETLYIVSYILEDDPRELGNHLYGITFLKYPETIVSHASMSSAKLDEFFATVINSSANTVGGDVKSISESLFKEYPGRKAFISIQNGTVEMVVWSILVESRLYLLQVISPVENVGNESIDTFFNSFELLSN